MLESGALDSDTHDMGRLAHSPLLYGAHHLQQSSRVLLQVPCTGQGVETCGSEQLEATAAGVRCGLASASAHTARRMEPSLRGAHISSKIWSSGGLRASP